VQLQPGGEMQLKHVFAVPTPPPAHKPKPQQPARPPTPGQKLDKAIDKLKFWERL